MQGQQKHIVIVGAGYAGLMAAVRLAQKTQREQTAITLVNGAEHFVERIRLHQMAANQPIQQRLLTDTLKGTHVDFVRGWVTAICADDHSIIVHTERGERQIRYDYLMCALGSTIDRGSTTGVREHAYVLTPSGERSIDDLRGVLPALNERGGRLLVVGGGATGIEAAAEFAESFPNVNVQLVTRGAFGDFMPNGIADYMETSLRRLGVTIQDHTTISQLYEGEAVANDESVIPFDVCLWTGGFTAPALARESGLKVNERGQILVDPFLRSISHSDIFACGDAAMPVEEPGAPIRMSAFTALVTGAHAAQCVADVVSGKTPEALSFAWYGQAIALGRHDAVGFLTYPADKPLRPYFTGWFGQQYREFFAWYAGALSRLERRFPGVFQWQGRGRYAAAKRQAAAKLEKVNQSA